MFTQKQHFNWRLFFVTRRQLIIGAGLIAAGVAIAGLATYPQISGILSANGQLAKENEALQTLSRKQLELQQVRSLPEFGEAETVDAVLPSTKPLIELLTSLNAVASAANISITEFEISPGKISTISGQVAAKPTAAPEKNARAKPTAPKTAAKKLTTLSLQLTAEGSLANVDEFLRQIEKITPITTVTSLSLSREYLDESQLEVNAKAELGLETYFFTQPVSVTLNSPLPKIGQQEQQVFNTIKSFIPPSLEKQTQIQGGGQIDFFGIEKILKQTDSQLGGQL